MRDERRFFVFVLFRDIRRSPAGGSPRFLRDGTPVSRAELLLGLALILLSLLGTWYVFKCRSDALALEGDPVVVQGKVLALWVTTGKGSHHHVRYEYAASTEDGLLVQRGEAYVSEKDYRRLEVGGPVPVVYCRTNPANHVLKCLPAGMSANWWAVLVYLVMMGLLAAAGCINLWAWWVARARPRKDES
jgi:hypothetical protein